MKKVTILILTLTVLLFSCKKDNDNNNDWSEEDQAFYDNVITLQDQAAINYTSWMKTMDSMEVINKLQLYFLDDSTVTSATIGGQGIAVQYSNGMRGGIFLNPQDGPVNDTMTIGPPPSVPAPGLNEKSLVNKKKMVLLNPSYWERAYYTNLLSTQFSTKFLPKINFNLEHVYKNQDASVDRFTELSEYGIIHIYSHGWAWPKAENMTDVYLMTGEEENDATTEKYALRMMLGDIFVANAAVGITGTEKIMKNVYFINEAFVASRNDFSKDTVLFYGGFCYSFLGKWPEIQNTFAKGAYFGFDWSVLTVRNADWASWLIFHLSDIATVPPRNPSIWMSMPAPEKSYEHEGRIVSINFVGDPTLTLFKDSLRVETWWPISITQTTAEVRGIVLSEGGYPVTERGVCWSLLSNPTIANNYAYIGGGGTEVFTIALTNLTPDTIYYVRAYAINSKWTVYGNQHTFRTLPDAISIGQSYGGGIIFYIDGTGEHGLIASTSDQSGTSQWGCQGILIGTSTSIGTGQANTTAIVNGCGDAGIAARICDDLVLNGYNDWFLPSKDELNQLYIQQDVVGGFTGIYYWSSSEFDGTAAWMQYFGGSQFPPDKTSTSFVRAVRAF